MPKKIDVIDNKHDPEHGSNANGMPLLKEKQDYLKKKFTK